MMMDDSEKVVLQAEVSSAETGKRLDQALALLFKEHSRTRLKDWILQGAVCVNGEKVDRPKMTVAEGDSIVVEATVEVVSDWEGEEIPLNIVYEDEHILIINKTANFVVHPAAGNWSGTLVNALLAHAPELKHIPRAGIVHRLDKDTTGLLVVAKTLEAQTVLVQLLQARQIKRIYETIVYGEVLSGATIDAPIGRHPKDRLRMAVVRSGKPAITHYRLIEKFPAHTHLRVELETGRTHQIRVHFAHIRHSIVGDKTYGGRLALPRGVSDTLKDALRSFPRQALHAQSLSFEHPATQKPVEFSAPLPEDMQGLLKLLRENAG